MFRRKRPYLLKKTILWLLVIASIGGSFFLPKNQYFLASSIISTTPSEPTDIPKDTPPAREPYEVYDKHIRQIHDTAHTLQDQLTKLYTQKETLKQALQFKQSLLKATEKQNNTETGNDSIGKNLQTEIDGIQQELEKTESRITTIYTQITTYNQEIESISEL